MNGSAPKKEIFPSAPGPKFSAIFAAVLALNVGCSRAERVLAIEQDGAQGGETSSAGAGGGVAVSKVREDLLTDTGLTAVALGGYLNGESYQQDGIVSFGGFQYAAFWNSKRHVVLARRALPEGAWSELEFSDYVTDQLAAVNAISIGICPQDGTIHLAFDNNREGPLHYRKSLVGLASEPSSAAWSTSSFSSVSDEPIADSGVAEGVAYPRFVTKPDGNLLLALSLSDAAGSTDEALWEYAGESQRWSNVGRFIAGIEGNVTTYIHGLSYTRRGTRLHVSWGWRESVADVSTNHDLLYAYSDDDGRTWLTESRDVVAVAGTSAVTRDTVGTKVWTIDQNRGLLNSEHMVVDEAGGIHVLLCHMPDSESSDADFVRARTKSEFFHYGSDANGHWTRTALSVKGLLNFRGKLAIADSGNAYAILPDLRIAGATAAANYTDWKLLDAGTPGRFFSDPLVDNARLLSEGTLSVFYPERESPNIYVLDYTLR